MLGSPVASLHLLYLNVYWQINGVIMLLGQLNLAFKCDVLNGIDMSNICSGTV